MKRLILALLVSALAVSSAVAESWKDQAAAKRLSGAALSSFMKKCESDAKASCDKAAVDKKLSGAAKDSFATKCVKDATGG